MTSNLYLDFHVLQTVPASNINRDQSGRPKTAVYGGVERARVSSQAWKRAARLVFHEQMPKREQALRTKRVVGKIADAVRARSPELSESDAVARSEAALKLAKLSVVKPAKADESDADAAKQSLTEYLLFVSNRQIGRVAEVIASADKPTAKQIKEALDQDHGIEIALFGRMVANDADFNVDASCQVAHALSTHATRTQFDYFTAVDDANPDSDTGAGMIGTVEFNSSTFYRYATINVTQLLDNLGSHEAALEAIKLFTDAFATSMPTGKQNTFANRTAPDAFIVMGRRGRPVNLVGAFETPIENNGIGYVTASAKALADYAKEIEETFGPVPEFSYVTAVSRAEAVRDLGDSKPLEALTEAVCEAVRERLQS